MPKSGTDPDLDPDQEAGTETRRGRGGVSVRLNQLNVPIHCILFINVYVQDS